jgi:hypothetical protein
MRLPAGMSIPAEKVNSTTRHPIAMREPRVSPERAKLTALALADRRYIEECRKPMSRERRMARLAYVKRRMKGGCSS